MERSWGMVEPWRTITGKRGRAWETGPTKGEAQAALGKLSPSH